MIYVVGSSFNSLAAANAFVNKGLDVTILDVGKKSTLQNKQIIKDLLIPIPPIPQQQEISSILSTIDVTIQKILN